MNIFKAMAVRSVEEATRAIPVIDFGPAFRREPGGLDLCTAQVRRACEQVGFFYMAGHGAPQAVTDAAFAASREFHALRRAVSTTSAPRHDPRNGISSGSVSGEERRAN